MSDSYMDLGPNLRDARTSSGLSQRDLAERTGLAQRTISELEQGRGDLGSLDRVVQVLGVHFVGLPRGSTWAERVRKLRARAGLSLAVFSERTGVSVPALSRLEAGQLVHVTTLNRVLAVLAPRARKRQPQVTALGLDGGRDMRFTPSPLLDEIVGIVGPFCLDPCAHPDSPVQAGTKFFGTDNDDGLKREWHGVAYVNPPYSVAQEFTRKSHAEWAAGRCSLVVALLPVRTHTAAFHDCVANIADVFFLRGRMRFEANRRMSDRAPFGTMLVVWGADREIADRFRQAFPCAHLPALPR